MEFQYTYCCTTAQHSEECQNPDFGSSSRFVSGCVHSNGEVCGDDSPNGGKHQDVIKLIHRQVTFASCFVTTLYFENNSKADRWQKILGCVPFFHFFRVVFAIDTHCLIPQRSFQYESRPTGYGLCPALGVHSVGSCEDETKPARLSIRCRHSSLTMASIELAYECIGKS